MPHGGVALRRRRSGRRGPVKIYIPFGPARRPTWWPLVADHLQQKLGQAFVVEDKPGASGNIGTDAVAKAEPDGYTLGISIGGPLAINTLLFSKMPYDPIRDLASITMLATQPSALAVNARLGVDTVAELIELLKTQPRQIQFRLDRQRLAVASRHGGDRAQERHRDRPHPLCELAPGDDRAGARRRARSSACRRSR